MWVLQFLPDGLLLWTVNIILVLGLILTVVAFTVKTVPFLSQYRLPIQILGLVLMVLGVYFRGGFDTEVTWRERVADVRARLQVAEQQSNRANEEIARLNAERVKMLKERTDILKQYIDSEISKYDAKFKPGGQCEIPKEFIHAHNQATEPVKK